MSVGNTLTSLCLIFVAIGSAAANVSLKSTMRAWKADAATIDRMLTGPAVDEAEARRILQGIAGDAAALIARVNGTSAQARDVKARFEKFASDIQSAIDAVASRDKMKGRYAQMRADCRSCHDIYAN